VAAAGALLAATAAMAGCGDDGPPIGSPPSTSAPEASSIPTGPGSEGLGPPTTDLSEGGPGLGSGPGSGSGGPAAGDGTPTEGDVSGAALRDPDGVTVGTVLFEVIEGTTRVTVQITDGGEPSSFHALVVHANDDPSNGDGCEADPDEAPGTWFVSADGHLTDDIDEGASHQGDLPNVWVMGDGTATAQVMTDRMVPADLVGAAVVLHALPNNSGNVPVGDGPGQYTPNSERSQTVTEATGNAGTRIACGVVQAGGGAAGSPVR